MRSLILVFAAALALFAPARSIADDITPLGIGLEDIDYPYPVHFLDLTIEGQRPAHGLYGRVSRAPERPVARALARARISTANIGRKRSVCSPITAIA